MKKAINLSAALTLAAAAYLVVDTAEHHPPRGAPSPGMPVDHAAPVIPAVADPRVNITSGTVTDTVASLPVRADRNCDLELRDYVTPSGEMFSAYDCTPKTPRHPHPYANYDNGSLELIAYSDPEAAALLGRRLVGSNPSKSYEMLLRATALSGDIGHLAWLADQAFSTVRIDGDLQISNVKRRYELAALAVHLGGDPAAARYFRDALINAGVRVNALAPLDERVDELLQSMRDVQRLVYGEIRYGGQNDA
jgi:hypothetical protein